MYYCIILLICFLDQLSKFFAEKLLVQGSTTPVVKNIFHITLIHNTGVAFGMFKGHPEVFTGFAALAAVIISVLLIWKKQALTALEKVSLSFILGGTLGNLIDRVRLGYVIDFIDFRVWPVFNIADSFITIGAIMLGVSIFIGMRKRRLKG